MLKEKLSHSKIGVEMHSLSVGLISPADETDVTLD